MVPDVPVSTLQISESTSFALSFRVPTFQVPVEYVVDPEGAALTNVVPVGHESVIVNEVA